MKKIKTIWQSVKCLFSKKFRERKRANDEERAIEEREIRRMIEFLESN